MPKGKRGPRPEVSTKKGKQTDLPGVEPSARRIGEIEDLADEYEEVKSTRVSWSNKETEAMENLVASMKRHDRNFYSRTTWGKVVLKESKTKAKVEKESAADEAVEEEEAA